MNYEEKYLIEIRRSDGVCEVEPYDDVIAAGIAYTDAAKHCGPGERVKLIRTTNVTLATKIRA